MISEKTIPKIRQNMSVHVRLLTVLLGRLTFGGDGLDPGYILKLSSLIHGFIINVNSLNRKCMMY